MKPRGSLFVRMMRKMRRSEKPSAFRRNVGALLLRNAPGQITCGEFENFVFDYYEGQLSPRERGLFDVHMEVCPTCETYFQSYVKAVAMGKRLCKKDEVDNPIELPEELVAAVLAARRVE